MKKRRMKLLSLMLTVAVTMTTVLPVSAATVSEGAVQSQESSQTLLEGQPDGGQQEVGEQETGEETPDAKETPDVKETPNVKETPDEKETPDAEVEAPSEDMKEEPNETPADEAKTEEPSQEVLEERQPTDTITVLKNNEVKGEKIDEHWTLETVVDASNKAKQVIYRYYENLANADTLTEKWVFEVEKSIWEKYEAETDVTPVVLSEDVYQIGKDSYYLNAKGQFASNAWKKYRSETGTEYYYYFNAEGKKDASKTGLRTDIENGVTYFLEENGEIFKNGQKVINGVTYVFGADGKCTSNYKPGWEKTADGWKWKQADGTYAAGTWILTSGKYYYLKSNGVMATYWTQVDGKYYFLGADGSMRTYWQNIYGKYYWLGRDGAMKTGWQQVYGKWYYLGKENDGAMKYYWQKIDGKYYWLGHGNDGAMKTYWQKIYGKYYFLGSDGSMRTGWQNIYGKYYYLGGASDGSMKTGWQKIGNKKYYFGGANDGVMKTGWQKIDGKYYYFGGTADGAMKTGWTSVGSKWYYLDSNGVMQTGYIKTGNTRFYMDANGVMQTGWQYVNGYKLYFKSNGALQQDVSSMVSGPYRLRVNRTTCMVTVFAKDGSNGYIIPVKSMTCSVGLPATPTPTGTFYIGDQDRWHILMGPSWGQYTSHVYQGIFIHSVAGGQQSIYNLNAADYNNLGRPASHGCIRLCVRDAKWIYTNVSRGSQITIGDGYYEPFDKPATIKLAPGTNLMDPTQC